jgi:hypothetical protein
MAWEVKIKMGTVINLAQKFSEPLYDAYALGITNLCFNDENSSLNYLMFYEIDDDLDAYTLERILEQFENDCILFESSKNHYHFVSLTLDLSKINPVSKARRLSRELEQDYIVGMSWEYLTLRISSKFLYETNEVLKTKPRFLKVLKLPKADSILSLEHMYCYRNLGLPFEIINVYKSRCRSIHYKTKYLYYYTNP